MRLKPESCLRVMSTHSRSACHHLSTLQSPHILVSSSRCWQIDRLTWFHTDYHGASRIPYILSRIIEFANYSLHTDYHGASRIYISCHEFDNSIIRDKEKHPWSSVIIRVIKKNSTIRKFVIKRKFVILRDHPCDKDNW